MRTVRRFCDAATRKDVPHAVRTGTRILLTCLLFALVLAGGSRQSADAVAAPDVVAEPETSTSIVVTWRSDEDPHRWWVIVTGASLDRSVGQRTVAGDAREVTVRHLAPGSSYKVRVVGVDANGAFGGFSAVTEVRTPSSEECRRAASGSTCVVVGSDPSGPAVGTGLGSLHGITARTSPERIRALEPTAWRFSAGDTTRFALARQYGGTITLLLSDPWMNSTGRAAPWANWDLYRWWLAVVVDGHVRANAVPDFWEVQNEPNPRAYAAGAPATPELVREQHRVAAEVIHARLPDARVIGPGAGYPTFGTGLGDIEGFVALGAENPGAFDAVSWHEIGGGCLGYCDGSPRAVLQHADDARAAAENAGVDDLRIHVNEWGAPWNYRQPGSVIGYLSSLAYAGVDVANPACWSVKQRTGEYRSTCFADPGMLDGLLLEDGSTPTDAWWTHRAFAQMTGPGFQLLPSTVADPYASSVATIDEHGVIRIAVGRHSGCHVGTDEHCPGGFRYQQATSIDTVVATAAPNSARFRVTVQRIASTSGGMQRAPATSAPRTVRPSDGYLGVGSLTLGDGEATIITIRPS